MRNNATIGIDGWLADCLRATDVAAEDAAEFHRWLANDYEPLAGGWQY